MSVRSWRTISIEPLPQLEEIMERELLRYLPADDTSTSGISRRHARRHRQAEPLHGRSLSELPSERHGFSL